MHQEIPNLDTTRRPDDMSNDMMEELRLSFALTSVHRSLSPSYGYCSITIADFPKFLTKGFLWISDKGIALIHKDIFADWCHFKFDTRLEVAIQWPPSSLEPIIWIKNRYPTVPEPSVNACRIDEIRRTNEVVLVSYLVKSVCIEIITPIFSIAFNRIHQVKRQIKAKRRQLMATITSFLKNIITLFVGQRHLLHLFIRFETHLQ